MQSANGTTSTSSSDAAAYGYTDLETVRERLIELEQNRIFSDEDLAMLMRHSSPTNLKGGIESRSMYRRSRAATTAGGRAVIRSWKPTVWVDDEADTWNEASSQSVNESSNRPTHGRSHGPESGSSSEFVNSSSIESEDSGWKQFAPSPSAKQVTKKPIGTPVRVEPAFIGRNLKRPSRLKHLQSRSFIGTILANIIFIPKQAVSSLVSMVVPHSDRRAC